MNNITATTDTPKMAMVKMAWGTSMSRHQAGLRNGLQMADHDSASDSSGDEDYVPEGGVEVPCYRMQQL